MAQRRHGRQKRRISGRVAHIPARLPSRGQPGPVSVGAAPPWVVSCDCPRFRRQTRHHEVKTGGTSGTRGMGETGENGADMLEVDCFGYAQVLQISALLHTFNAYVNAAYRFDGFTHFAVFLFSSTIIHFRLGGDCVCSICVRLSLRCAASHYLRISNISYIRRPRASILTLRLAFCLFTRRSVYRLSNTQPLKLTLTSRIPWQIRGSWPFRESVIYTGAAVDRAERHPSLAGGTATRRSPRASRRHEDRSLRASRSHDDRSPRRRW